MNGRAPTPGTAEPMNPGTSDLKYDARMKLAASRCSPCSWHSSVVAAQAAATGATAQSRRRRSRRRAAKRPPRAAHVDRTDDGRHHGDRSGGRAAGRRAREPDRAASIDPDRHRATAPSGSMGCGRGSIGCASPRTTGRRSSARSRCAPGSPRRPCRRADAGAAGTEAAAAATRAAEADALPPPGQADDAVGARLHRAQLHHEQPAAEGLAGRLLRAGQHASSGRCASRGTIAQHEAADAMHLRRRRRGHAAAGRSRHAAGRRAASPRSRAARPTA